MEYRTWEYRCTSCGYTTNYDENEPTEECPECHSDMENIGEIDG